MGFRHTDTMATNEAPGTARLAEFRSYLRLLAAIQLPPLVRVRIDPADIVADTLAEAARDAGQHDGQSMPEFAGWLRRLLARNIRNRIQHASTTGGDVSREPALAASIDRAATRVEQWLALAELEPTAQAAREEQVRRLAAALDQLPDDQRTAVELKHLQGWTVAEVAEQMNCSAVAIAGLLRRALVRLHEILTASP